MAIFVVSVLVASIVVFLFMAVLPGDPAQVALGVNATPELLAKTRAEFGIDRPLVTQYFDWIGGVLHGDFGRSYVTARRDRPAAARPARRHALAGRRGRCWWRW